MVCRWDGEGSREIGEMNVQSMREMYKDFCPNVLQTFLENIDRRTCSNGSLDLIPVFQNTHRNGRPSPSAMAGILEYLVGVPSKATSSGNEKKQSEIVAAAVSLRRGGDECQLPTL